MQLTPAYGSAPGQVQARWMKTETIFNFRAPERRGGHFPPIAVSFIDAAQMATDGGTCAINNNKKRRRSELI